MKLNWGKGLILFFILFFVWIFLFVLFAMRQNIDLVADDYYQQGAKYSGQIEINKRSLPYQDSLEVSTTGNQVRIGLSQQLAFSADSMQLYFFKSDDKTKDIRFNFQKGDSVLVVDKGMLVHGRYQVFVTWSYRKEKYSVTKVLDIQ